MLAASVHWVRRQPTASVATALTGKTPWNISAAAQFSLFDAAGTPVGGPLAWFALAHNAQVEPASLLSSYQWLPPLTP